MSSMHGCDRLMIEVLRAHTQYLKSTSAVVLIQTNETDTHLKKIGR